MAAIVLLPGLDGTGTLLTDFAAALGKDLMPMVVSYPESEALGYDALVKFVRLRLPTDQPFLLLGESFSGPIAVSLAASKPPGLLGLILCCTFVRNPIPVLRPLEGLIDTLPIPEKELSLLSWPLLGRFFTLELATALERALNRVSVETLRARLRAVLEVDVSDELTKVEVPILYLRAVHDRLIPDSASEHILDLQPSMKIIDFDAPHLLLQTCPYEAASIVEGFRQKVT